MLEIPMRPRKVRQILWSILIGALIGAGLTWLGMARASADPISANEISWVQKYGTSVCATLDAIPTDIGVDSVMVELEAQGYAIQSAANITVASVEMYCPAHMKELKHYASGEEQAHYAIT